FVVRGETFRGLIGFGASAGYGGGRWGDLFVLCRGIPPAGSSTIRRGPWSSGRQRVCWPGADSRGAGSGRTEYPAFTERRVQLDLQRAENRHHHAHLVGGVGAGAAAEFHGDRGFGFGDRGVHAVALGDAGFEMYGDPVFGDPGPRGEG